MTNSIDPLNASDSPDPLSARENMQLMKILDDAWNTQDWDEFSKHHSDNVTVYWPGKPTPTIGKQSHKDEAIEFFHTFPDNHIENNPYVVLFGQGDWTCSVAKFSGSMKGSMRSIDGRTIPPTNRKFQVEFCTVAQWKNGEILVEKLFYDAIGLLRQIGL